MPRLPQPGKDTGEWGTILNEFLSESHAADGSLKAGTVGTAHLQAGSITSTKVAPGAITTASLSDGSVTAAKVAADVATQAALDAVASAKANTVHSHAAADVTSGTLPLARGGTGGTDATSARSSLGLGSAATMTPAVLAGDVAFTGAYARLPLESVVWAIGDSITANGYTAPTSTNGATYTGSSYLQWASQLSGARFRFGGIAATGGYTSAQVLATHLPTVLAAKPQACVVLCGTNDVPLGGAATMTNLMSIWTTLARAGITPILATLTPRNDFVAGNNQIITLNSWIARQARLNGWPLVDFYAAVVDPATNIYLSGYNLDTVHPNVVGAKAMGQALATQMSNLMGYNSLQLPALPVANAWPGVGSIVAANALHLTGTGQPSNWGYDFGSGATFSLSAMSANEGVGNWFNMTRTGTDFGYRPAQSITLVPGNRMSIGFRYKTTNVVSTGATFELRLATTSTANNLWRFQAITGVDVALGTVYEEFVVPVSIPLTTCKYMFTILTGNATLSLGQMMLRDLTAEGI